jgi:hypothetical protein
MYEAYALLKPDSEFTLAAAANKLAAKFPNYLIAEGKDQLKVTATDWEIQLTLVAGPTVLDESRTMEEHIGGHQDDLGMATCDRRVEVASDQPDPEMEHFADYLSVIEVLQSFKGVIAVDPQEPSLL